MIRKSTVSNCIKIDPPKDIIRKEEWVKTVEWHIVPRGMRKGLPTPQSVKELANTLGISPTTICVWRTREDFWGDVKMQRMSLIPPEFLIELIHAMYKKGLKDGDPRKVKLMLTLAGRDVFQENQKMFYKLPKEILEIRDKVFEILPK